MRHYISYESICEEKARDFLGDNVDALAEGIAEQADFDDVRAVDEFWHEQVTDVALGDGDARFVLDESRNVEEDRGLWEGADPEDALRTQAAYTFSSDVKREATEIYDRVKDEVSDLLDEIEFEDGDDETDEHGAYRVVFLNTESGPDNGENCAILMDADGDDVGLRIEDGHGGRAVATLVDGQLSLDGEGDFSDLLRFAATAILKDKLLTGDLEETVTKHLAERALTKELASSEPEPIEPGTEAERVAIRDWLRTGREIGMRSGYPLGSSYIDARSGTMWGTKDHAYVEYDRELSKRLPHLSGKYRDAVESYYDETFGGPEPTNAEEALAKAVALIKDNADGHELSRFARSVEHLLEASASPAP